MKILGIDHGTKRLGFAISDEDNRFAAATGIETITKNVSDVMLAMAKIAEHKPEKLLVGIPLGLDSKPTQQSQLVKSFCDKLGQLSGLEIVTWQEAGSTIAAKQMTKLKGNRNTDSEAARILLQEYLDFINTGI